ncbi:PaaX family transcriptional regulator C-terminal domain-containing protein [Streptomyces phyllanthi]|nr:PaaX family transcriptional regulator C-terminal domain-containing protein [Streptomyces phyllanthi]
MEDDDILDTVDTPDSPDSPQPRPQSLMLAFFGNHVLEEADDLCVYSGSIIDVLGRVGVGEQAVRSTLTRMVNRGLLRRQREGRRMYFGLTPQAKLVLHDGRTRIWQGAVNDDWDGSWTLLGFSFPDSWKRQRHDLRSRLTWSGFGALYSGLWIAPGNVDVAPVVSELGLTTHVKIFHARADGTTDIELMIRDTWDLESIAARYVTFDKRWTALLGADPGGDPIGTRLRLVSEWLWTIRTDPRLPARHLPPAWPARPAQETFRRLAEETAAPARRMAAELLDTAALR